MILRLLIASVLAVLGTLCIVDYKDNVKLVFGGVFLILAMLVLLY